jgi:hypothetical protein
MSGMEGDIIDASRYVPFRKLDLTYKVDYPSQMQLSQSPVEALIAAAFAKWQAASPFKFQPITSGTPDIPLSFGSVSRSETLAQASFETHAVVFDKSRTWVDTDVVWTLNHPDLLSVAVHEIGHVLGLLDNDNQESVMYKSIDLLSDVGSKFRRAPIPQVDINNLNSGWYRSLFSEHYARQGQTVWFKRENDGYIPSNLPAQPYPGPVARPGSSPHFQVVDRLNFQQVSASGNDVIWALDGYSYAYDYGRSDEGTHWTYRGRGLRRVAVFDYRQFDRHTQRSPLVLGIFPEPPPVVMITGIYGVLKRYDYYNRDWISVHMGSLGSGYRFKHVAVGGSTLAPNGSVWAVGKRPGSPLTLDDEDIEVLRYNGDIVSGNGDWEVVAMRMATDPSKSRSPMHDLDVGRWPDGSLAVCGTLPKFDLSTGSRVVYKYDEGTPQWSSFNVKRIPPDGSTVEPNLLEIDRYHKARGKCVSVGDDGTVVAMMGDRAFRSYAGSPWTELPRPGARWVDISVVNKERMWGVDQHFGIFSTIV